jgi:hypothetical protein
MGGAAAVTVGPASDARDTSCEVRAPGQMGKGHGSEAGRGVGAAGETPTVGVVVESRTDANSTSRLARWFSRNATACPSGEWSGRAGWCASRN